MGWRGGSPVSIPSAGFPLLFQHHAGLRQPLAATAFSRPGGHAGLARRPPGAAAGGRIGPLGHPGFPLDPLSRAEPGRGLQHGQGGAGPRRLPYVYRHLERPAAGADLCAVRPAERVPLERAGGPVAGAGQCRAAAGGAVSAGGAPAWTSGGAVDRGTADDRPDFHPPVGFDHDWAAVGGAGGGRHGSGRGAALAAGGADGAGRAALCPVAADQVLHRTVGAGGAAGGGHWRGER